MRSSKFASALRLLSAAHIRPIPRLEEFMHRTGDWAWHGAKADSGDLLRARRRLRRVLGGRPSTSTVRRINREPVSDGREPRRRAPLYRRTRRGWLAAHTSIPCNCSCRADRLVGAPRARAPILTASRSTDSGVPPPRAATLHGTNPSPPPTGDATVAPRQRSGVGRVMARVSRFRPPSSLCFTMGRGGWGGWMITTYLESPELEIYEPNLNVLPTSCRPPYATNTDPKSLDL